MNDIWGSYKVENGTLQLGFRKHLENQEKYKKQTTHSGQKWCAVGQLIVGIVSTVSGIVTILCSRGIDKQRPNCCKEIDNSSFGMWSGLIYIITGVLGAYGRDGIKRIQTPCYIGFSILSCVVSAAGIIIMFLYFAFCSGCKENEGELTAKIFFLFTGYVVLIFSHGNGMTVSIIGASFSCCGMKCCNQSPTFEEFMSQLQDDARRTSLISSCPKPPRDTRLPFCQCDGLQDTSKVEQIYFEADDTPMTPPISYVSVQEHNSEEEETEQKSPTKQPEKTKESPVKKPEKPGKPRIGKPEKPNKRYLGIKGTK